MLLPEWEDGVLAEMLTDNHYLLAGALCLQSIAVSLEVIATIECFRGHEEHLSGEARTMLTKVIARHSVIDESKPGENNV